MSVIEILQVNLMTKDDFISPKPFQFNPNVVKFFTTKTFLNESILTGNNIEIKPSLFLNHELFDKAIKLLKDADYGSYTNDEILNNNIEVFREALFKDQEQIPIGSKKYYIIKSKYLPNSFKKVTQMPGYNQPKNVTQYTITFELSVLNIERDLKEGDFSRANCKLNARELNSQAEALFGISLGLDGEFPPMKTNSIYNPNSNSYGNSNMYGNMNYGNSNYGNNNMYGNMNYGNNYGNSNMNYSNSNLGYMQMQNYNTAKNEEVLKTRRDIRELLRDYEKKKEIEKKEKDINDWQNYKEMRLSEGLPVVGMNEWITKRQLDLLENKYKVEWLNYKRTQESARKPAVYDKWLKDKLEEELENSVEMYMKEWIAYKSDQALLGKVPSLNEWLKERIKKRRIIGGKPLEIRSIKKRIRSSRKQRIKKRTKHNKNKRIKSKTRKN